MSIYKRENIWWIDITTPNGVRVRKSARTSDRKSAQEFHDRLKAELWRVHRLGERPRRTWQQAAVRWLQEKKAKADYRQDKAKLRWLDEYFGHLFLDEITRDLVDEVTRKKGKYVKPATVNRYLALIRSILLSARDDWEWVATVPKIRLRPESKRRVRWITVDEARRLIAELPEHLAYMAAFSLCTGLRRSNVTCLRWDAVDIDRGVAWVHPDESKSRKAIAVPLSNDAVSILRKLEGKHDTHVFTYRCKPVFQTSTKAWYLAMERAGIENFRWHDLRHTWASWHVQNGTSLQELMELGGWASYVMVLRYAHLASGQLATASNRVSGVIDIDTLERSD